MAKHAKNGCKLKDIQEYDASQSQPIQDPGAISIKPPDDITKNDNKILKAPMQISLQNITKDFINQ